MLEIKSRNAIMTAVRMEWTLEAFFAEGGTTLFVDRITAALGIHASTMKIVSVYEGSLIINYDITVDDDDEDTLHALADLQASLFDAGSIDLGAPILDYTSATQINDEATSSDFTPVTISTSTYSQSSNSNTPSEFSADLEIINEQQITYQNTSV